MKSRGSGRPIPMHRPTAVHSTYRSTGGPDLDERRDNSGGEVDTPVTHPVNEGGDGEVDLEGHGKLGRQKRR
jgi:hypothetical protein